METAATTYSVQSLEAADTKRLLLESHSKDTKAFKEVIVNCFLDASVAASETASFYLLRTTLTDENAYSISDIVKSLPTVVPARNALALARVAAFLAISFDNPMCAAPLEAFSFSDSFVKRHVIESVISRISVLLRGRQTSLIDLLNRACKFFDRIVSDPEAICRFEVIRALASLPSRNPSISTAELAKFLLTLKIPPSPFVEEVEGDLRGFDEHFESYFVTEVARLQPSSETPCNLIFGTLVRSFDFSSSSALQALSNSYPEHFGKAVVEIGLHVVLNLLTLIAGSHACQGRFSACLDTLLLIKMIISDINCKSSSLHDAIVAIVCSICTSIASVSTAAGADEVTNAASFVLNSMHERPASRNVSGDEDLKQCDLALENALSWNCPGAVFAISLLRRLLLNWRHPKRLGDWISDNAVDFINCIEQQGASNALREEGFVESMVRDHRTAYLPDDELQNENAEDATTISLSLATILMAVLHHGHARVRLQAVEVLTRWQDVSIMLFCLPPVMIRLQEETNGAIAIRILQDVILSECLTTRKETSTVTFRTMMRTMRLPQPKSGSTTYQTCLIAIAKAAKYAPGMSTAILQTEIEKVRNRFDDSSIEERITGAASILTLVRTRPARGTKFIPFISLCISSKSLKFAPEAAALCFDAMYAMVFDEVLDPVKAVKVVLKNVRSVTDIPVVARRCFLRLLGSTSAGSGSKKGIAIAEKVVAMLRTCLAAPSTSDNASACDGNAQDVSTLSWDAIAQAAEALAKFSVDEILRIAHCREDPLIILDAERARLEAIQQECGQFVDMVIDTASRCANTVASDRLQALLSKIAKAEWEHRPRGAFDPERIAKLTATAEALRRSRKARIGEDDHDDGVCARFGRAVDSMPSGVIKTLCARCAHVDVHALQALAFSGAVTTALPWAELVDHALQSPESESGVRAACLRVLRCAAGDDYGLAKSRARWFSPHDRNWEDCSEAVEVFLGCLSHFEDRVSQVMDCVLKSEVAIALIHGLNSAGANSDRRLATTMFLDMMERREDVWNESERHAVEDAFSERCLGPGGSDAARLLGEVGVSRTQIRLACRLGETSLVKDCVESILVRPDLCADLELIAVVGRAARKFGTSRRRSLIFQLAENCNVASATLTCYAVGGGVMLPDVRGGLIGMLSLCDPVERVALRKMADSEGLLQQL